MHRPGFKSRMLRYRIPALDGRAGAIDVGVSITYDGLHDSPEIKRASDRARMWFAFLIVTAICMIFLLYMGASDFCHLPIYR
jgi:hypothetical protein